MKRLSMILAATLLTGCAVPQYVPVYPLAPPARPATPYTRPAAPAAPSALVLCQHISNLNGIVAEGRLDGLTRRDAMNLASLLRDKSTSFSNEVLKIAIGMVYDAKPPMTKDAAMAISWLACMKTWG